MTKKSDAVYLFKRIINIIITVSVIIIFVFELNATIKKLLKKNFKIIIFNLKVNERNVHKKKQKEQQEN